MQQENWYKTAIIAEDLYKEAGIKNILGLGLIYAVIAVLSGSTIWNAAQKYKVSEKEIQETINDKEMISRIKDVIERNKEPYQEEKLETQQNINPKTLSNTEQLQNNQLSKEEIIQWIITYEGKPHFYKAKDPNKKDMIIGYGFNLTGRNTSEILSIFKRLGINYKEIMSGKGKINIEQANELLDYDINRILNSIYSIVPNFDKLPKNAKLAIVDMSYNMGMPKLSGFNKFLEALSNYDYSTAAKEMINSKWYRQVGRRSKDLVRKMEELSENTNSQKNKQI